MNNISDLSDLLNMGACLHKKRRHGVYDEELKKEASEKVNKVLDEYMYLIK